MIYLTRRERFNAAHRLFKKEWSDKKNYDVFGKCSNPNWHGHNYELLVTVKGETNPETGFVINLKQLSKIVKERIRVKNGLKPVPKLNNPLSSTISFSQISSTFLFWIRSYKP